MTFVQVQPDSMFSLLHSRAVGRTNFPFHGVLGGGLDHGCNLGSADFDS
jgi:hypothetical protein